MSTQEATPSQDSTSPAQPEVVATNSTKKKFEWIWRIFSLVVAAIAAVIFQKVYVFQTHPHFEGIREGNISEMLVYGIPFGIAHSLFDWAFHYYCDDLCMKHYITEQRYLDPEARRKRVYTLVKWGYSLFYYLVFSVWAYKIMVGTTFMPTWLGGFGDPYSMATVAPRVSEATLEMKVFYICQFGKHFSRGFGHVFIRPQGNFFEYTLHHGLSVFLIMFSYLTNQWHIGIFVLLLHDSSDFFLILARAYKDYKNSWKALLNVIYANAGVTWILLRIILFISVCIVPSVYGYLTIAHLTPFELEVLNFCYAFMIFMMISLEVMHIFWTYFIVESIVSVNVSTKVAKHTYD